MSELRDRVVKYINGVEKTLEEIKEDKYPRVVQLARQYVQDAKYYLEKGDLETALVDVVYAEGLLDAIRYLEEPRRKVFVGGTFDILHPGHIEFLRRASQLGDVYVAVARDKNAEKVKGRKPINDEQHRLEVIRSVRYVFEAFLGDEKDFLKSVERVKPDVIFLGPDQRVDEDKLKEELEKRGIKCEIVRLHERINKWQHSSTSSIIKEITNRFCNHT